MDFLNSIVLGINYGLVGFGAILSFAVASIAVLAFISIIANLCVLIAGKDSK